VGEVLLVLVPALATAALLFLDLQGLRDDVDWKWWALGAFVVFVVVVVVDLVRLTGRIVSLEDQRASLVVRHTPDSHPYWMDTYGYRLGVLNEGPASADHVRVNLDKIEPLPEMALNVLSSPLGHKGGYAACAGDYCSIDRGDEHYFDLLNRHPNGQWLLTVHEQTLVIFSEGVTYAFKGSATSRNRESDAPVPFELAVSTREDGWLDVRMVESKDDDK
jgi:hypothetical protein